MKFKANIFPRLQVTVMLVMVLAALPGMLSSQTDRKPIDLSDHWLKEENFPLSQLGSSIVYIPLETRSDCYIPNAYQCSFRMTPFHFFVIPNGKPVMVFDRNGKFQGTIGSIGKGPREVISIHSYVIHDDGPNGWFAIYNPTGPTVMIFSMAGRLIREFHVDKNIRKIMGCPEGNIVGLSIDFQKETLGDARLIFMDSSGAEIKRLDILKNPDPDERVLYSDQLTLTIGNKDSIDLVEFPFEKIYRLNPDGGWQIHDRLEPGKNAKIEFVWPIGNYYLIQAHNPGVNRFVALKETGEVKRCSFGIDVTGPDICGFYNDMDGGLPFWPATYDAEREMGTLYDASALIDCAKGDQVTYGGKAPSVQDSFKKMAEGLSFEDNPVIAVVKMK